MSDVPFSLPKQPRRDGKNRTNSPPPLDGEVIPPTIRVVHPDRPSAPAAPERSAFRLRLSTALLGCALVFGLAGVVTAEAYRWHPAESRVSAMPDATVLALAHLQDDLAKLRASVDSVRQDETVRGLKKSVDVLKAELDGVRSTNTAALAQLSAKLDAPVQPASPNLSEVMTRIDKLDRDPRLGDIAARLDRIEHQVASPTPTGSVNSMASHPPVAQSIIVQGNPGSATPPKSLLKPAVLDNWIVRDVYSGVALVEGRRGGVREVVPGEVLPGAGEVRSIERRGRAWIVVTSRGIIDTETW